RVRDEVLVLAVARQHLLPVRDLLDGRQLVAAASGVLEVEGFRGPRHLLAQPAGEQVGAALHEEPDLSNPAAVLLAADPAFARPGAAPDVKVEAHLALLEDVLRAGPEGQELAQALDSAAQALRVRGGPR